MKLKWIKIGSQGGPPVNHCRKVSGSRRNKAIALEIGLGMKWCEVDSRTEVGRNIPALWISAGKRSEVSYDNSLRKMATVIVFSSDFRGWTIWSAEVVKHSLRVCLVKI